LIHLEKEQFLFLTQHFDSLTTEETAELEVVQFEYPYCQVAHILAARGAQNSKSESFQKKLHLSAVYSTDRAVLKSILARPAITRSATSTTTTELSGNERVVVDLAGDDLIHEVMADLDKLKELKHNFEVSFEEYGRTVHSAESTKKKTSHEPPPKIKNDAKVPVAQAEPVQLADDQPLGDSLIEEIRHKKKLQPEGSRQKEQIEIINQFIKKQPTIPKSTQPVVDNPDLAEKSISLTDNIVSETLVEILLRQGKKDKAIEVLKKLIWKFPQKKAIFAAQIEELRK
jgi:hypothetical protein